MTVGIAVLGLLTCIAAQGRVADLDMFHELALAREALSVGSVPRTDVFAYTATVSPSIHHEWGTGALLYLVVVTAGLGGAGVLLLKYGLLLGTALACYACARLRGGSATALVMLLPLGAGMMAFGLAPVRAHMFTFLFTAILLVLLELDRRGRRWWILCWLPMYAVWVNVHGGFVVGVGLFGLYCLECTARSWARGGAHLAWQRTRHLWLVVAAMGPLVLVNPYGWHYFPYLWHALLLDRALITEWGPLWDRGVQSTYVLFYAVSLVVLAYAVAKAGGSHRLPGLLLVIATGIMALRTQRLLPLYGLVWLAYMPGYLTGTELVALARRIWTRHMRVLGIVALAGGIVLLARTAYLRPLRLLIPNEKVGWRINYPVGAVDYMRAQGLTGNLMTPFESGAFVSWKLHPAIKVGMDSRYEVAYPPGALEDNLVLYRGLPGWDSVLGRFPTDGVLVPSGSPLIGLIPQIGASKSGHGWTQIYRDDGFIIFWRADQAGALPRGDRSGEVILGRLP